MFTGIIRTIGIVKEMKGGTLQIVSKGLVLAPLEVARPYGPSGAPARARPLMGRVREGDSVAVNGVCLTVDKKIGRAFGFSLMSSTLRATTLGDLEKGDVVNLELPLKYGDRVDGHFLLGHVDGVGKITVVRPLYSGLTTKSKEITVRVPVGLKKYCVAKGSVALDGVSLTIVSVRGRDVLVSLTPYTLAHTRFANVLVGDRVNVEVDALMRYLRGKNIIRAESRITL